MRVCCVLLLLLGLPLTARAQREHRADRPPTGPGAIGLPLPSIGLPAAIPYQKPWEWTVATPWWERQQPPAWERQGPPPWERGHVAKPVAPDPHQRRGLSPSVIYVMQPYAVAQPYPVYVTVPAPPVPEPPPPPSPPPPVVEVEEPPPAPFVAPTGSRTLYVIRGCYLGNVKPEPERLPAGCDISRMRIYEPN